MAWPTFAIGTKLSATVLAAMKNYIDNVAGTSLATPLALIRRDAAGRAQVVSPAAAADIATKQYVDGSFTASERAHTSGSAQTNTAGVAQDLTLATIDWNDDAGMGSAGYTASATGRYQVNFQVTISGSATTVDFFASLRIGTTDSTRGNRATFPASVNASSNGADIVSLTAGQVLKMAFYASSAVSVSAAGAFDTFFSVQRIS
jgi:hypothetical protein